MLQDKIFYLIAHYGYIGIFGALVLGIIGLPVPDEVLMTYSGYLISQGRLSYILTLLIAMVGSFAGMSVSYFVGRKFGYPLLEKHGRKIRITKEKLDHTRCSAPYGLFCRDQRVALPYISLLCCTGGDTMGIHFHHAGNLPWQALAGGHRGY
ncbi:SNARE associated Golgi protein [compost metagenome]